MEQLFLAFVSLFTMVNPLGLVPVYLSLTAKLPPQESRIAARKAVVLSFFLLAFFALGGQSIFRFFQISIHSLKVVGGIIFFMTGYDMLSARLIRTKENTETETQYVNDISITPLAIPMICGPGAITVSIVLMNEAETWVKRVHVLLMIAVVLLVTLLVLRFSAAIGRRLGPMGNRVMMRLMGLIVMVIAVEFLFAGLTPLVRRMLRLE